MSNTSSTFITCKTDEMCDSGQSFQNTNSHMIRDRQWTDLQGGPGRGVNLGGSSGSTDNPKSKKIFESFRPC